MAPGGRRFSQEIAIGFSRKEHLILVCGHYEGIDHRVAEHLVDDEISIGDYVLTNGALAAAVVVDAVARLIPGVLGDGESSKDESFSNKMLEYPQYTRPADFRGWRVPEVLLSGNHALIRTWREEIGVIQHVVGLTPKLYGQVLPYLDVLEQTCVQLVQSWSAQRISR